LTKPPHKKSAILSSPGARSAYPGCIRGGGLLLRRGKSTWPLKPEVKGMRPLWKSRERQERDPGTDSGAGLRKFECGPGQPPGPHWSWVPALPCHRGCGAMTASVCSHSQPVRLLPKPAADSVTPWQRSGNCRGGQRPSLLR
jgi:hypothetical protein